ncbi:hypothetical protein MUK42_06461 [Musa troglodytarum]|uniref:Reverse transcriptase Ty1/copia-type domain-containing protein n=1 Tax=Musa troglodytarum TaxID=320322 RepID=A0A9E7G5E9_9LILI|nr:hypothetical protein MUK42_06461 [Musa troglodytarum]
MSTFGRYSTDEYVMLIDAVNQRVTMKLESEREKMWLVAMQEEMDALQMNHTYDLVQLPKGMKSLKNKLKTQEYCSQPKYKARLVVKGFGQKKDPNPQKYRDSDLRQEQEIHRSQSSYTEAGDQHKMNRQQKSLGLSP